MRTRVCLATVVGGVVGSVVVAALLTACGGAPEEAMPPAEVDTGDAGRARTATGQQSGPYDLRLEAVRAVARAGGDLVVLRFAGDGRPGWVARYVDEAVVDGSGEVVDLDGDGVLQLDVSGTPTQVPGGGRPVRRSLAGAVVDLHAVGAWEGVTQVFLGLDGGRAPFRVSALDSPSRLVVHLS